MKKIILTVAVLTLATAGMQTARAGGVHFGFSIGLPLLPPPVIVAPAPRVVYEAPAYCPPPVVYRGPAYCPPPVVVYREGDYCTPRYRYYGRGERWEHERWEHHHDGYHGRR